MPTQSTNAKSAEPRRAGTALLWCVLAGVLVTGLLCVEPPGALKAEFWNPTGALRLLADLVIFYCIFIIPLFRLPERRVLKTIAGRAGIVLFSGTAGLVMLSFLTDASTDSLVRLVGFSMLTAAAAAVWVTVLRKHLALYYAAAFFTAVGVPTVLFFLHELFRSGVSWPQFVSPFTAWRMIADGAESAFVSWIVFGTLFVCGIVGLLAARRRTAG